MSVELPTIQKAQPPKQLVCWGCGEDTYTTFRDKRFCGKDCLADHYFSEGYSEAAARYEKREQNLKNKIKELAEQLVEWKGCEVREELCPVFEGYHTWICFKHKRPRWACDNERIRQTEKELLGLSKQ